VKKILLIIIISSLYSYDNNPALLEIIFDPQGWKEVVVKSDSLTVYRKNIEGIDIPVFRATAITAIHMEGIIDAILDADGQETFLKDSHLKESELLDYTIKDTTFLYQILDLPVISDRHYITKNYNDTISANHYRLNWMINSKQNFLLFDDFIEEKKKQHKDPIFIVDGLGAWEVKALNYEQTLVSYYVLVDPGGWIPNYLVIYANRSLGPDTVLLMLEEGSKRDVNRVITTSYLVCLRQEEPTLLYQRIDPENLLIMNNNDLQSFAFNHKIKNFENWVPHASEDDCLNGVCLNRIYRIEFEHKKSFSLNTIISELSNIPSVLYVEEEVSRNRLIKKSK
jgi:hypothetical protein